LEILKLVYTPAMHQSTVENRYETYATLIAPAATGCALGLLFGRGMERRGANIAALTLLVTGAAIAAPLIADLVQKAANRPGSNRGSRKRLEGIRNSALPHDEAGEFFALEEPEVLAIR
jgi:hypothetical protein